MKKKQILYSALLAFALGTSLTSCSDYLDVEGKLGENNLSIERIFSSKEWTEQWLAEAYAWLTFETADIGGKDYCITNFGDDMCYGDRNLEYRYFKYAEYNESWKQACWLDGYKGIRQASIFIENIDRNTQFTPEERADLKAQARFLRAYLYWQILRKYGPMPLIPEEGLDYTASYEALAVPRSSYDECAEYISKEMCLAAQDLPERRDPRNVMRPTRGAALATRAKALLYAASPINNPGGPNDPLPNERFSDLVDHEGRLLMGQTYDEAKWARAVAAAKDVVEMGKRGLYRIYTSPYIPHGSVTEDYPETVKPPYDSRYSDNNFPNGWADIDPMNSYKKLFNGDVFASDNPEMIFTTGKNDGGKSLSDALVRHQLPTEADGYNCHAMTGKQCDAYDTNEGKTFDKDNRPTGYVTEDEMRENKYPELGYINDGFAWKGVGVSKQYVKREPRFYASCAYNGCFWGMSTATNSWDKYKQVWYYREKNSGWIAGSENWLPTGIGIMKYVSPRDSHYGGGSIYYKTPLNIRYADVLLWYAEALNELTSGKEYQIPSWDGTTTYSISRNTEEMSYAISQIRIRGGVPDYEPEVYNNAAEFRKKLKHERQIEFFAENSRYYDLRRWKDAEEEESQQIYGCNPKMSENERDLYHTMIIISNLPTTFNRKMYFWPIQHDELRKNKLLTQNPGWTNYE